MARPFSVEVGTESWRAEARTWIVEQLDNHEIVVTGELHEERIRPWSGLWTFPTDAGRHWLKVPCRSMAFEAALAIELATILPENFEAPLAVDLARGWQLRPDLGPSLGATRSPSIDDWRAVLAAAASAQRRLVDSGERLREIGLPDMSPGTVTDRFERVLRLLEDEDRPFRPETETLWKLHESTDAVARAVTTLESGPLPTTWQHGDLHPGNVASAADRLRIFDLGDGQWAHALEILLVPYGIMRTYGDIAWSDVVGAWTEQWNLRPEDLDELWPAANLTQAVNRTATWMAALESAAPDEMEAWGPSMLDQLTRVLDE